MLRAIVEFFTHDYCIICGQWQRKFHGLHVCKDCYIRYA